MFKKILKDFFQQNSTEDEDFWVDALRFSAEGKHLCVRFPHAFFGDWFFKHKKTKLEEAVQKALPSFVDIHYADNQQLSSPSSHSRKLRQARLRSGNQLSTQQRTLENFIFNDKNAFSLNILTKIANHEPGTLFNPVLLCARNGTGKTHILQALAQNFILQNRRICLALHVNDLVELDLFSQPDAFWTHFTAFFIDDIQDLQKQPELQYSLIRCIDKCPPKHQIFLTISSSLKELESLDERLQARLTAGLILDLKEPDVDVRLRFLQQLCLKEHIKLNRRQMLVVAQRCSRFRHIEGLLCKISALARAHNRAVSENDIEEILNPSKERPATDYQDIMEQVAQKMNVTVPEILGTQRQNQLVLARQLAMYICRTRLGLSYPELGRIFGGKDHSTVIHSIRKIEQLLLTDTVMNNLVTQLTTEL